MKQSNSCWSFNIDKVCSYAFLENFLNKDQCNQIIKIGKKNKLDKGKIGFGLNSDNEIKGLKNKKIRDSYISWIYPNEETDWLYRNLTDSIISLNNSYFNFQLFGITEGLQFTYYKSPSGHYGKHVDKALNGVNRKLSVVIQLSDPSTYKGGELKLYESDDVDAYTFSKKQGTLCLFPSYTLHEVTNVTQGERYSLVAWVTGPDFK
jgi:PKHD-type hydroxylase